MEKGTRTPTSDQLGNMPSINKTKSGERFRAPTDQARKMERKRENKKNKRDRQQIRQAMAKYCNLDETTSKLIILERQILGLDPQPFHIDVLKKKQKVLTDLIQKRRLALQQAKDEEELRKFNDKVNIYYADCRKLAVLAEQAKLARDAVPEFIPLPVGDMGAGSMEDRQAQLLGPMMVKKKVDFQLPPRVPRPNLQPPGPPCGVAPNFSDSDDEDDHGEEQFDEDDLAPVPIPDFDSHRPVYPAQAMFRNPASFPPMPPPRMPFPPKMHHAVAGGYNPMGFSQHPNPADDAVISSAPQINKNKGGAGSGGASMPATVSAAPELRNLRGETVKLVPARLMMKRKETGRPAAVPRTIQPVKRRPEEQKQAKSTDEAYNEFMKELDGII